MTNITALAPCVDVTPAPDAGLLATPGSVDALGEAIADLAARLHAATYDLLVLLRDFDARLGWNNGFLSCAHWLHWRTGIDLGAAREKVRVARALATLPRLSSALSRGDVSYAKVRAVTRVATPENEAQLLDLALTATAAQVERVVRAWRGVDRAAAAQQAEAQHLARQLTTWVDDDGMVVVRGRLPPEVGAVVLRALDAAADRLWRERAAAPDGGPRSEEVTPAQRRADALGLLAEVALSADLDAGTAGDRYQVVLHVDVPDRPERRSAKGAVESPAEESVERSTDGSAESLAERPAEGPMAAPADALPPSGMDAFDGALEMGNGAIDVSAETSQRLACDASLVRMSHGADGTVLDVGRQTRTIPPAIRRALHARDASCRFPGCTARRCDAHHLVHWAQGGATRLDNLVLLCRRHHRAVHEGRFTVAWGDDRSVVVRQPDGQILAVVPPLHGTREPHGTPDHRDHRAHRAHHDHHDHHAPERPLDAPTRRLTDAGLRIGPRPPVPWDGTPFDLGYVVDVLYRQTGTSALTR